ncbi:MAG: molybdenum cofactor guanylyltransferase MobA [Gammaproteobacteria bacterium]
MSPVTGTAPSLTGCILAGGEGRRLGGRDKGLIALERERLAAICADRLRPHVDRLLISANRNLDEYRRLAPVVIDGQRVHAGPLAGFLAAMRAATTPLLVTCPCDSPFFPQDLVTRLRAARADAGADVAVAVAGGRMQSVFALLETGLAPSLAAYLDAGERRIDAWFRRHRLCEVVFDDAEAFANINTPADLEAARARLGIAVDAS